MAKGPAKGFMEIGGDIPEEQVNRNNAERYARQNKEAQEKRKRAEAEQRYNRQSFDREVQKEFPRLDWEIQDDPGDDDAPDFSWWWWLLGAAVFFGTIYGGTVILDAIGL